MEQINPTNKMGRENGFALLMTLIVVTIVIAIGLTVLDLSTKQVRLASNATDSEIAFHAANAGMECARYWRRQGSDSMENGQTVSNVQCFASTPVNVVPQQITDNVTGDGEVYKYEYSFTWAGNTRCSQITTLVASSTDNGDPSLDDVVIQQMPTLIQGYPSSSKTCAVGERCTVLSVRGYNKPCGSTTGYGTVQREVLLQF